MKTKRQAAVLLPLCQLYVHQKCSTSSTSSNPLTMPLLRTDPAILFTVRSSKLRNHAGEVSFPGGLFDPKHDQPSTASTTTTTSPIATKHLANTAMRETREEVPSISDIQLLGHFMFVLDKSQTIAVHPFVGHIGPIHAVQSDDGDLQLLRVQFSEEEVSDVFVMTLEQLLDPRWVRQQHFRDHPQLAVPSWLGPHTPRHLSAGAAKNITVEQPSKAFRNTVMDKHTGRERYRVWGLTAYLLGRFLKQVLVPLLRQEQ